MTARAPAPIRRGLVAATTTTAVLAVALVAVPLSVVRVQAIGEQAQRAVDAAADGLATSLGARLAAGEEVDAAVVADRLLPRSRALVVAPGEAGFAVGPPLGGSERSATATGEGGVRVTLTVDDTDTVADQRRAVAVVVALGLAALAIAAVVGRLSARRIAAPIEALAAAAARAGHGDLEHRTPRSGVVEVDEVAEAMDATLDRLAARLTDERRLSDHVAHQLRNGLTALRLQVEVAAIGVDDADRLAALERIGEQVDRFEATITDLTRSARRTADGEVAPLGDIAAARSEQWRPSLEALGRTLAVSAGDGGAPVAAPVARQVLDVLVDNAVRHGAGEVRVQLGSGDAHAVAAVEDDGPGIDEDLRRAVFERGFSASGGTGLGLAIARDLAEGAGGRLQLTGTGPTRFELWLPILREPRDETPGG